MNPSYRQNRIDREGQFQLDDDIRSRLLQFRLRWLMCVIAVICASVAAFVHVGSLGSALASMLLAAACIYMGLRKSVVLIFVGGGFLVLAAYHCIQFVLSGRG